MDVNIGSSPSPVPKTILKTLADKLIIMKENPNEVNAVFSKADKLPRVFNAHEVPAGMRNGNDDVLVSEFYNRKGFRKCSIPGCNESHTTFKSIIVRHLHQFITSSCRRNIFLSADKHLGETFSRFSPTRNRYIASTLNSLLNSLLTTFVIIPIRSIKNRTMEGR